MNKQSFLTHCTIITISTLLLFSVNGFSQVKFGVKGGTNIKVSEASDVIDGNQAFKDASFGVYGGVFARLTALSMYLQPEVTVSTLKNLDVPVLAGLKLGPLRAMGGPLLRFDLNRNANLAPNDHIKLGESMKIGFQAGAGFDISKFSIDVRYEGNLNALGSDPKFDSGPAQLLLSAGFAF